MMSNSAETCADQSLSSLARLATHTDSYSSVRTQGVRSLGRRRREAQRRAAEILVAISTMDERAYADLEQLRAYRSGLRSYEELDLMLPTRIPRHHTAPANAIASEFNRFAREDEASIEDGSAPPPYDSDDESFLSMASNSDFEYCSDDSFDDYQQ